MSIQRRYRFIGFAAIFAGALGLFLLSAPTLHPATPSPTRLDVLESYAARFADDVYPLMARDVNGCRTCHVPDSPRMLQVLGSPKATFSLLLEQNLFDPEDPMAIRQRVATGKDELHMPKFGKLTEGEIERIGSFSADLTASLGAVAGDASGPADERFPDSLLFPFDGPERVERPERLMSYYQLRRSFATLFGAPWLEASGSDPFRNKAHFFGGADFKSSFDISRTASANYLSALREVSKEVARRYVSASPDVLFPGFDPAVSVRRSRRKAQKNVRALFRRIFLRDPERHEIRSSLDLVARLQRMPEHERVVRFSLTAEDSRGRRGEQTVDVRLETTGASVSRFRFERSPSSKAGVDSWLRVGDQPFRFEAGNDEHLMRFVSRPGNHINAFDAFKLVRVEAGKEAEEEIILDNLDPECTLLGEWMPVRKDGDLTRAEDLKKKYEQDLHVVGETHVENRTLGADLATATMALRIPRDGDYNVYLNWLAIPERTGSAMVEVHSATAGDAAVSPRSDAPSSEGTASFYVDQTESTLDDYGETQWELFYREVYLGDESDYFEINNSGVDAEKKVIVADAVKFVPLDGGSEILVDNGAEKGFEHSDGWATDKLVKNSPGRGKMFGEDLLHYPPAKNGRPLEDQTIDADKEVWARYRPVSEGGYAPGWYSIYVWTPGGYTHSDWVKMEIHGTRFAPVASIEASPTLYVGETARLNASETHHPGGETIRYRWTHDAQDLGLNLIDANTATPGFVVPQPASPRPGWAGLIEALLQHPEFLMPQGGPDAAPGPRLARVALDLAGRVPTQGELRRFRGNGEQLESMVDAYLASPDFKDFFFHRTRAELLSRGTEESDEPARLWTYIATNDLSYRELFTADYGIDTSWNEVSRPPEHGPSGILTMKGYLVGKPGLPSYTYPARVLTFAMGIQFEISDAVEAARKNIVSTTDPASLCYSCHKLLTPLAYQRESWDVDGNYRTEDEEKKPIDDSDRGVVPDYPFKGEGLGAFAAQVVKKERFVRTFVNLHHDMLFHRQLRVYEDQRDEYKELYEFATANDLKIRPLLKKMILMRNEARPGDPIVAARWK